MNLSTKEIMNLAAIAYHTHCNGDPDKRALEVREYLDRNPDFDGRILQRLKSAFPWLLERAATEYDFHDFCQAEGIEVVFNEAISNGIYARYHIKDRISHFIFLNREPRNAELRYVMFHEAAHYLFHFPRFISKGGRRSTRYETDEGFDGLGEKHIEAEIVASLCVTKANHY